MGGLSSRRLDLLHKSSKPLPNSPQNKRLRPLSSPLLGENERGGEGDLSLPPASGGLRGVFLTFARSLVISLPSKSRIMVLACDRDHRG
jgi:hypothetical protein